MGHIIELQVITKRYGQGTPVVTEVLHSIDCLFRRTSLPHSPLVRAREKARCSTSLSLLEPATASTLRALFLSPHLMLANEPTGNLLNFYFINVIIVRKP